jgi:hypothetical protein
MHKVAIQNGMMLLLLYAIMLPSEPHFIKGYEDISTKTKDKEDI